MAAGAVLAAASLTGAASVTPSPHPTTASSSETDISTAAVQLAAASSIFNIPVNVLIDTVNIPAYEVDAMNYEAAALLFTGSWWVSNATNVWGTDPADPPKYIGGAMLLLPNPYLSKPIGNMLAAMAIAELPVNSTCGTTLCPPFVPFDAEGAFRAYLGLDAFPIINNFFTVPLSALYTGYTFDPEAPGQQSFGGYVPTNPFGPDYDLPGTQPGPNGTYLMPWAGDHVNLTDATADMWTNYVAHLMADPADNAVRIPTGQDFGRALTNLFAGGVVDFNPFTPGMSYCPTCEWPEAITPEGIVGALSAADPGNTLLSAWLNNHGWQDSQGAPGTPPTPSTPESVQPDLKTLDFQAPSLDSQQQPVPPPADDTPPPQGRHAKPDPGPLAAINAALKPKAATTPTGEDTQAPPKKIGQNGSAPGGGVAGALHSMNDRLSSAVSKVTDGFKGGAKQDGDTGKSSDTGKSGDTGKSTDSGKSSDNGKPGRHARSHPAGK